MSEVSAGLGRGDVVGISADRVKTAFTEEMTCVGTYLVISVLESGSSRSQKPYLAASSPVSSASSPSVDIDRVYLQNCFVTSDTLFDLHRHHPSQSHSYFSLHL